MSNEYESKIRSALEAGKPLLEAFLADLDREAKIIKERDLDPRKLAEEPRVQEARSSAIEALEYLTGFAKSLDSLARSYGIDLEKKVDVDKIKQQLAAAPAAGRSLIDDYSGGDTAEWIKHASEDAKVRLIASADTSKEKVDSATQHSKESVDAATQKAKESADAAAQKAKESADDAAQRAKESADAAAQRVKESADAATQKAKEGADKAKDSSKEMIAALGWLAAAATVIYIVFMDEKRRRQAKSVAKAAGNGLLVVANSATKKD